MYQTARVHWREPVLLQLELELNHYCFHSKCLIYSCYNRYQIMSECWKIEPKKRPTFKELCIRLDKLLFEVSVRFLFSVCLCVFRHSFMLSLSLFFFSFHKFIYHTLSVSLLFDIYRFNLTVTFNNEQCCSFLSILEILRS